MAISAVVNTLNEEKNLTACLNSLTWADEIVVFDGGSTDKTLEIAKKFTNKIYSHHDNSGYVETARNGAIEKATSEWIFIIDADEIVPESLGLKLQELSKQESDVAFYQVPRRNTIFGKTFEHTGWWPDYHIRFFKKGSVKWTDKIHVPPETVGKGEEIQADPSLALQHSHYISVSQYLQRLDRYTNIQAINLQSAGYHFVWTDVIVKPVSEFLTRYFAWQGYKDGLHGLVLSLLQAFSFLTLYVKVWELEKFSEKEVSVQEVFTEVDKARYELKFWFAKATNKKSSFGIVKSFLKK